MVSMMICGSNEAIAGVFDDALPALFIGVELGAGDGFDGVLPGARGDAVVGAGEIRLGDLQIERGLAERLVLGEDDLFGDVAVLGLQTEAPAGFGVDAVELAAAFAAVDQTVTSFHRHEVQPTKKRTE